MLLDIINLFCLHSGYKNPDQRLTILNYINRAAKDLYNKIDADSMLHEIVLQVPAGMQVALPPFIGELKGLREYGWTGTIPINSIGVPRFSSDSNKFRWRNWTYKGKRPVQQNIINACQLTLTAIGVETTPALVVITGRGVNSHRIVETVTMTTPSQTTVNSFMAIESITSVSTRAYDVTVQDVLGNILAVLANNEPYTSYVLVDVSRYSWLNNLGNNPGQVTLAELLYKPKFYPFLNDTDTFIMEGFDDAIGYEAIALYWATLDGKDAGVASMRILSVQCINNNITNDENGQCRKISFKADMSYKIYTRFRQVFDWRRSTWGGRY
jgi:hypothetical protein